MKTPRPKTIKFRGAVYRRRTLTDVDVRGSGGPGSTPLTAHLKLVRAPDFGGYSVELEALEGEGFTDFTDDLDLPGRLRHATGQSGHQALASLAAAWSRAGFLD